MTNAVNAWTSLSNVRLNGTEVEARVSGHVVPGLLIVQDSTIRTSRARRLGAMSGSLSDEPADVGQPAKRSVLDDSFDTYRSHHVDLMYRNYKGS